MCLQSRVKISVFSPYLLFMISISSCWLVLIESKLFNSFCLSEFSSTEVDKCIERISILIKFIISCLCFSWASRSSESQVAISSFRITIRLLFERGQGEVSPILCILKWRSWLACFYQIFQPIVVLVLWWKKLSVKNQKT